MKAIAAVCFSAVLLAACGGQPGADGQDGEDGSGLATVRSCTGFATPLGAPAGWGYSLYYSRYSFADGSIFVTCEVAGGQGSSTGLSFYKAIQNGAATGSCLLTFDIDTVSSGWWSFTTTGANAGAKYNDPGSPDNARTFALLTCTNV